MPLSSVSRVTDAIGQTVTFLPTALGLQMPVTQQPNILLMDNCNGTVIDTVNRWNAPVLTGAGTMTQANGNMIAATGTGASASAAITSIESFEPSIGNLNSGTLLGIEAAPGINTNRCYGAYTRPVVFAAATPVQDGYVWEYDITGFLGPSIYSGGVRILRSTINPLTLQPYLAAGQTFIAANIAYQGLNVFFYINNLQVPVLTVQLLQPSTLNLPNGFHCINHTVGPAVAPTWTMQGSAVFDQSGTLPTYFNGQTFSRQRSPNIFKNINAVATGATLWTPAAGRKFRLMGYVLSLGAAGTVTLTDSTPASVIPGGIIPLGAAVPFASPPQGNGSLSLAVNSTITAAFTGAGPLTGYLFGTEE